MNNFYKYGELERIAFQSIVPIFKQYYDLRKQKLYYYLTYNDSNSSFDILMHIYDLEGSKIESNVVEVKIRTRHFNDLLLEKYKYDKLKKLKKKEQESFTKVNMLYINFTPKSTYLFNLDKVNMSWEFGKFNKTTAYSRTDKVEKKVAMLDILESSDLHYIFDENEVVNKVNEKLNEQKAQRCIFESVEKLNNVK